jgi:hypothetical protein
MLCFVYPCQNLLTDNATVLNAAFVFILEEDKYGTYAKLLVRYFLAEGIVCGHSLVVASQDLNCEALVRIVV